MQNKPPVSEDSTTSSWQFEVTDTVNNSEQRLNTLLESIKTATTLADLQSKIQNL